MLPLPELSDVHQAKRLLRILRFDSVEDAERQFVNSRVDQEIKLLRIQIAFNGTSPGVLPICYFENICEDRDIDRSFRLFGNFL